MFCPEAVATKGTPYSKRDPSRLREASVWLLERHADLARRHEELLTELLDLLEPKSDELAALANECRMEFFLTSSAEDFQVNSYLPRELLERLLRLPGEGLALSAY